ncbi:MAG: DsbE family thiol:disulfide interchange protein [Woeseiaceae bacterium]
MNRFVLPLLILAALSVAFVIGLGRDPTAIPSPLLSQPMPAFELDSLTEPTRKVSEKALLGEPSLVNVWGSWCFNCAVEHDFLMKLSREKTIPIFGLNWNDELPAARQWLLDRGDPYVFSAFDVEGRVAIDLGVYGAPETFLLDANGVIVHKHIGPLDAVVWSRDFLPRLQELAKR